MKEKQKGKEKGARREDTDVLFSPVRKRLLKRRPRPDSKALLRRKRGLKRKTKYRVGHHPNSVKCWWQVGYVPNPKGRPKKETCITTLMKSYLCEIDTLTGLTHAALVAKALVHGSEDLNSVATKELLGRIEGAIKQKLEVEGHSSVEVSIGELVRELAKRKRKKNARRKG